MAPGTHQTILGVPGRTPQPWQEQESACMSSAKVPLQKPGILGQVSGALATAGIWYLSHPQACGGV